MRCRCSWAGCPDSVAVKVYTQAAGPVSHLEVALHEFETYYSLGLVEGIAHMEDHHMDEAADMACMVQK